MAAYWKTYKDADEMGISRISAAFARIKYLKKKTEEYSKYKGGISKIWAADFIDEINYLKKTMAQKQTGDKITQEDIERARNYPVSELIDFSKGKAIAFCHDDKNPSMYLATRINRAQCPVCNRSFDSIEILRIREGLSFYDAVRTLI